MVAHNVNPRSQETEGDGFCEFKYTQGYIRMDQSKKETEIMPLITTLESI